MPATNRTGRYRVAADPGIAVVNLGLACCTLEVESAIRSGLLEPESEADHDPATRTVVLVSGTVTEALAPAVRAAAEGTPAAVLSVGACVASGGPYWDAPTVLPGAGALVPMSAYVPGCPPRPEAIMAAVSAVAHA